MDSVRRSTVIAGILLIAGMVAGIFSVAPSIDSTAYLTRAAADASQVIIGAVFQFIMSVAYLGIALSLYPVIKKFSQRLALGFMSFRIIATVLIIIGTILLLSILTLSQAYVKLLPQHPSNFEASGNVLKTVRDLINHVFMVLVLCIGNGMFYILMFKTILIPKWLSGWGFFGTLLAAIASLLVLFQRVDIITPEYMILNIPAALQELILAIWLIIKGFDRRVTSSITENV